MYCTFLQVLVISLICCSQFSDNICFQSLKVRKATLSQDKQNHFWELVAIQPPIAINNCYQIKNLSEKVKISADPYLLWGTLTLSPVIQIFFALYIRNNEASKMQGIYFKLLYNIFLQMKNVYEKVRDTQQHLILIFLCPNLPEKVHNTYFIYQT